MVAGVVTVDGRVRHRGAFRGVNASAPISMIITDLAVGHAQSAGIVDAATYAHARIVVEDPAAKKRQPTGRVHPATFSEDAVIHGVPMNVAINDGAFATRDPPARGIVLSCPTVVNVHVLQHQVSSGPNATAMGRTDVVVSIAHLHAANQQRAVAAVLEYGVLAPAIEQQPPTGAKQRQIVLRHCERSGEQGDPGTRQCAHVDGVATECIRQGAAQAFAPLSWQLVTVTVAASAWSAGKAVSPSDRMAIADAVGTLRPNMSFSSLAEQTRGARKQALPVRESYVAFVARA